MPLSLAIAVIVIADLAIIGLLAFAMHLPSRLKPHVSASHSARPARVWSTPVRTLKRRTRSGARTFAPGS